MKPPLSKFARWALALCLIPVHPAQAADSGAQTYQPYSSGTAVGYVELQIAPDRWYLSNYASLSTPEIWIGRGWNIRAAELCDARGDKRFVLLRYPFEPVLEGELASDRIRHHWKMNAVSANDPAPTIESGKIIARGMYGTVRCIGSRARLKEPARAKDVDAVLAAARALGIRLGQGSAEAAQ